MTQRPFDKQYARAEHVIGQIHEGHLHLLLQNLHRFDFRKHHVCNIFVVCEMLGEGFNFIYCSYLFKLFQFLSEHVLGQVSSFVDENTLN